MIECPRRRRERAVDLVSEGVGIKYIQVTMYHFLSLKIGILNFVPIPRRSGALYPGVPLLANQPELNCCGFPNSAIFHQRLLEEYTTVSISECYELYYSCLG